MGKKRRILLAALLVVVLGGLVWAVLRPFPPEPLARGKPLNYWVTQLDPFTNHDRAAIDEAKSAIREIGTNALPSLLQTLRVHDSPLKTKCLRWASAHSFGTIHYTDPSVRKERAAFAIEALGPYTADTAAELVKILELAPVINLASNLTMEMREKDAITYLERNGVSSDYGVVGGSVRWNMFFRLSNGCNLTLEIQRSYSSSDGAWADAVVKGAHIQCYGAKIVSIPLTNAPGR